MFLLKTTKASCGPRVNLGVANFCILLSPLNVIIKNLFVFNQRCDCICVCLQESLQGNSVSYLILLVKYAIKCIGQNVINKTITRLFKNTAGFGPLGLSSNPATKR